MAYVGIWGFGQSKGVKMSVEVRAKKRELKNQLEAFERRDSREACTGLCMRTFKTSAGPACKNQNKPDESPDSCANCLRYSNYKP